MEISKECSGIFLLIKMDGFQVLKWIAWSLVLCFCVYSFVYFLFSCAFREENARFCARIKDSNSIGYLVLFMISKEETEFRVRLALLV